MGLRCTRSICVLGSLLFVLAATPGCRVVQSTAELPGKAVSSVTQRKREQASVDPVELQQQLMRFADEFTASMATTAEQLRRDGQPVDRAELQKWKLLYASDTLAIASGQNPVANLLDMVVLTTTTRAAVENYWLPQVYGESARPMLQACRAAEERIWRLSAAVLLPAQVQELREAIRAAAARESKVQIISHLRALGLVAQVGKAADTARTQPASSVLSLLQLDPLAGLDPAAREIAQTRLFAERALYVAQRMPLLLRWQTELLSYNLAATPEAGQVLTNLDRFGRTADALTRTAEQLPQVIEEQRQAAIKQVFEGLASERTNLMASLAADELQLRPTLGELRATLNDGNELTRSARELVKSVDTFMLRFDRGTNQPVVVTTNARPFDILDYAATAREVGTAVKELNVTINSLDKALPQLQKAQESFEGAGDRLLTRVFLVGAGLLVLLLAGALGAALAYRRLVRNTSSVGMGPPPRAP